MLSAAQCLVRRPGKSRGLVSLSRKALDPGFRRDDERELNGLAEIRR
jgi:hypothetical protein